jgi:hypothetical protein
MAFFAQKTPKAVKKATIQSGNFFLAKNISKTMLKYALTEECGITVQ